MKIIISDHLTKIVFSERLFIDATLTTVIDRIPKNSIEFPLGGNFWLGQSFMFGLLRSVGICHKHFEIRKKI